MSQLVTSLWFDGNAEEAARFYCSLFEDSAVDAVTAYPEGPMGEPGTVMSVNFTLRGAPFVGINGGPQFTFSEAISFQIPCADQAEVDRYWDALTADGGSEGPCGWCKDRFGLSWQVVPTRLFELFSSSDPEVAARTNAAMQQMKKLDIAALEEAAATVDA